MATAYTSLLGLALPVTGELSGTWGSTVNTEITALLDSAIAGTTTLSTDADVTLTTTTGAANTSRQAILLCSGARTALRTITAPAQSKIYTIINATTGGFSVKLVGAGPTTGVTIVAGESAVCAWNGSDFIKISNTAGAASFTNLTVTGTLGVTGVATFSAGTAALPAITTTGDTNTGIFFPAADTIAFSEGGVESARFDSAGNLGLGVTPSAWNSTSEAVQFNGGSVWSFGNSQISLIQNAYYDGTSIKYVSNGFAGAYRQENGTHYWQTVASGTAGNAISFTQAMTLDASGRLLLGTTSAGSNQGLTVYDATQGEIRLQNSTTGNTTADGFQIAVSGSNALLYNRENAPLLFGTNDTERARIDSSGNLLVGNTTGTGYRLNVKAAFASGLAGAYIEAGEFNQSVMVLNHTNSGVTSNLFQVQKSGTGVLTLDASGNLLVGTTSTSGNAGFQVLPNANATGSALFSVNHVTGSASGHLYASFNYDGSGIGSITQSGTTAVLYNVTSDQRLKENIVDAPEFGSVIDSLQVRSFDWKAEGSHQRAGFIAQELVTVAPEAVHQPANPDDMMAVDYSKLVPMLVKEIQSLRKRLAAAGI